jgi:phosphoglycerol transferase MdoB-like AlkP superfamily enzyme
MGIRFDFRTATIGFLPLYAIGLIACTHSYATWVWVILQSFWAPFLYFAVSLTTVVNFFYYRTFHNEIDVSVFGLQNDGTKAVMTAALKNYPSIRVILVIAGTTVVFSWITHRACLGFRTWLPPSGVWAFFLSIASLLLFSYLYYLGTRGNLRGTPLRQHDRMVSDIPLLNKAVLNAPMALSWAAKNYKDTAPYQPVAHKDGLALAKSAFARENLTDTTPENHWLAENPPHVVSIIMESFASNILDYDEPTNRDLMGSFRQHLDEDIVFRRFISEENHTMLVLARLLFMCPDEKISRSQYKKQKLSGTPFDVYKEKGYETAFIYPGQGSWHDTRAYMSLYGVDHIYYVPDFFEKSLGEKPEMASLASARGLPDEYIFPLVLELLEKATKPMFIVVLTLTNHLPDVPPPNYKDRFPLALDTPSLPDFNTSDSVKRTMLRSNQYSANCVGDFITSIKNSPLADRTVIGAFGDHRMINVRKKPTTGLFLDKAVPFYLYVPKLIQKHVEFHFAPERVGSQKDIFPTLYNLSLSNAQYYSVGGRNMLARQDDPARAFGYNPRLFIDSSGACAIGGDFSGALYNWDNGVTLNPNPEAVPPSVEEKIRAYEQLYRWQINARVAGKTGE